MAYNPDNSSDIGNSAYGSRVEAISSHGLPRGQWARPKSGSEIQEPQKPKQLTPKDLENLIKGATPKKAARISKIFKALTAKNLKHISDYNNRDSSLWQNYYKRVEEQNARVAAYEKRQADRKQKNNLKRYQKSVNANKRAAKRAKRVNVAGWLPWNPKYGEFRALSESEYSDIGMNYDKVVNPNTKVIHLSDGTIAKVIDNDWEVPLGFSESYGYGNRSVEVYNENGVSSTEYAANALNGGDPNVESWEGDCGHIVGLAYSPAAQVLKVVFKSGSTVIFFRVPSTVAGELLHFAKTGQTMRSIVDGKDRHVLGIRFWDLIRIRGTLNGAKYRYEYESGFPSGTFILGTDYEPYDEYSKHKSDILDALDIPEEYADQFTKDDILKVLKGGETAPGVFVTPNKTNPSKINYDKKDFDPNKPERYIKTDNEQLLKEYFADGYNADWDIKNMSKNTGRIIEKLRDDYRSGKMTSSDDIAKAVDKLRALGTNIV